MSSTMIGFEVLRGTEDQEKSENVWRLMVREQYADQKGALIDPIERAYHIVASTPQAAAAKLFGSFDCARHLRLQDKTYAAVILVAITIIAIEWKSAVDINK